MMSTRKRPGPLRPWQTAVACFGLSLSTTVTAADELLAMSLEQLLQVQVTGVSRFAQASQQAPSAVTVITRDQIRDHAWTTLADLLDAVPGLFVTTDRVYRYLGVRGFQQPSDYNTNVLLLIDGTPANDAVYQQAFLGSEGLLDMALVERVEFIPGPGSSVYGSNAILGVINVITRSGRTLPGTRVEMGAGERGVLSAAVRHGYASDRHDLLLSASAWRDDGESITLPAIDGTPYGRASGMERERGHRLMARYAWDDFTLLAAHAERRKGYAGAPYESLFGDSRTRARDTQWLFSLSHRSEWQPGLDLQSRLNLGSAEYRGDWAYPLPDGVGRDDSESRWWGLELQATDTRLHRHTLTYGLEFRHQARLDQRYTSLGPNPDLVRFDDRRSARHAGLYLQDEWRGGDTWRLNAGLRLDHYDSFGSTLNPRLGLIQDLSPRTTLKYLLGTAYRAPSVYEMHYHDGNDMMKANPNLDPERVQSLELVLEHRDERDWQWRGSLFQNRIRNMIVQEDDGGALVYDNRGQATVRGLSLSVLRNWSNGARVSLSTTWQSARDDSTRSRLTFSPRNISKADFTLPQGDWRATLEARHLGARLTRAGRIGSQSWANLALVSTRPVLGGASLALRVDNLFDQRLLDPASEEFEHDRLPREGRRARVTVTWQF